MALKTAKLSVWQRAKLLWGRPRRLFLNIFRPGLVRANLARRRGECRRCGACCQMGIRCPFLYYEDGLAACKGYDGRKSPNCRRFPMSERDLADRDVILPEQPCGFTFNGNGGRDGRD